jgi:hypothetical protein
MAFSYAGSLVGAGAPVIRRFQAGSDLYIGNMVVANMLNGTGAHVEKCAVAGDDFEKKSPVLGFVVGIADKSRTYINPVSGTSGNGDRTTYTATKATILANQEPSQSGGAEVDVCIQQPMMTLIRAPLYDTVWGTALTPIVNQTTDAGGTTIIAAAANADIADDYGTIYCRSGANRGQSRVITGQVTSTYTVTIPFPHTITAGDVFVAASCVLGFGGMDFTTGIDAIDGDNSLDDFYSVYYHEINLEEAGKECAVFSFWPETATSATT